MKIKCNCGETFYHHKSESVVHCPYCKSEHVIFKTKETSDDRVKPSASRRHPGRARKES